MEDMRRSSERVQVIEHSLRRKRVMKVDRCWGFAEALALVVKHGRAQQVSSERPSTPPSPSRRAHPLQEVLCF